MKDDSKRIRLLKIWEILLRDTDEEHPLGTEEILARLREAGIECVRSTLYHDIKVLQNFGYEILCHRAKQNEYYVIDRKISTPEVLILIDAVQAAGFIPCQKTEELVDKIASLAGSERGKVLKQNIVEFTTPKSKNNSILYAVSEISQAILNKKKIFFHYFDYDLSYQRAYRMGKKYPDKKKVYKLNPLGTVFDNGYYYVFCYDDYYGNITHYRIDRMDSVQMLDEPSSEAANERRGELTNRKRKMFFMYGGEERCVEFRVHKSLIGVIYDKFGELARLKGVDGNDVCFSIDVQISPTFFAWCCSLGNQLKITAPPSVVSSLQEYIQGLHNLYGE